MKKIDVNNNHLENAYIKSNISIIDFRGIITKNKTLLFFPHLNEGILVEDALNIVTNRRKKSVQTFCLNNNGIFKKRYTIRSIKYSYDNDIIVGCQSIDKTQAENLKTFLKRVIDSPKIESNKSLDLNTNDLRRAKILKGITLGDRRGKIQPEKHDVLSFPSRSSCVLLSEIISVLQNPRRKTITEYTRWYLHGTYVYIKRRDKHWVKRTIDNDIIVGCQTIRYQQVNKLKKILEIK